MLLSFDPPQLFDVGKLLGLAVAVHFIWVSSNQLMPLLDALADLACNGSVSSWHDSSGYNQDDQEEVYLVTLPSKHRTLDWDAPEYLLHNSHFFVLLKLKTNKMKLCILCWHPIVYLYISVSKQDLCWSEEDLVAQFESYHWSLLLWRMKVTQSVGLIMQYTEGRYHLCA